MNQIQIALTMPDDDEALAQAASQIGGSTTDLSINRMVWDETQTEVVYYIDVIGT